MSAAGGLGRAGSLFHGRSGYGRFMQAWQVAPGQVDWAQPRGCCTLLIPLPIPPSAQCRLAGSKQRVAEMLGQLQAKCIRPEKLGPKRSKSVSFVV